MMEFEVSAIHLAGMDKALGTEAKRNEVYPLVSPEAGQALRAPHSARWHPGRYAIECWTALVTLGGKEGLEAFNYQVTKRSFGPVVGPLVKLGVTLTGSTPSTIFARMGVLASVAIRGVEFQWTPSGASGGTQTITYPCPIPAAVVEAAWRGVYRVGAELVGRAIHIDGFEAGSDRSGRFQAHW